MNYLIFSGLYFLSSAALMLVAQKADARWIWRAWFPVLRELMLLKIAERKWWWIFLFFIPGVNVWASWVVWGKVSVRIGRSVWWGRAMVLPLLNILVILILGFGIRFDGTSADSLAKEK